MKAVLFASLLALTGTLIAQPSYALEQCNSAPKSTITSSFGGLQIQKLEGDYAKDTYEELDTDEVTPQEGDVPERVPGAKAKYTKDINCVKYRPAKFLDRFYVGQENCETYICHVVRR